LVAAMSGDGGRQVRERVELLKLTRARDSQQPFDGAFTIVAPRPEHDFAPLHDARFILPVSVTPEKSITRGTRFSGNGCRSSIPITVAASWSRSAKCQTARERLCPSGCSTARPAPR
jgi:hypothetical protein